MPLTIFVAVGELRLSSLRELFLYHEIEYSLIDKSKDATKETSFASLLKEKIENPNLKALIIESFDENYEFFAEYSSVNIVLLFSSPLIYLEQRLYQSNGQSGIEDDIEIWGKTLNEALVSLKNLPAASLMNLEDIRKHDLDFISEMFGIVKKQPAPCSSPFLEELLSQHISYLSLIEEEEPFELFDEALSSARLLGQFSPHLSPNSSDLKNNVATLNSILSQLTDLKNKQTYYGDIEKEFKHLKKKLVSLASVEKQNQYLENEKLNIASILEETRQELDLQKLRSNEFEKENAKLVEELDSKIEKSLLDDEKNSTEQLNIELELASLQINQLQEELEYYYLAFHETYNKRKRRNFMPIIMNKVFDRVKAERVTITQRYKTDGYEDIHLRLSNVELADGRVIDNLDAKLLNIANHYGIEFRHSNESLFRSFDDSQDEFGPYLRYFATAPESQKEALQKSINRFNASERILIMSTINAIAELLQSNNIKVECDAELEAQEWLNWRKASRTLAEHVDTLPVWLSLDSVVLKEEYHSEGYEHLWIKFDHLLVGNVWRDALECKILALNIGSADTEHFSDSLYLEFRELEDGSAQLFSWPPNESDEFGPKYLVSLDADVAQLDLALQDRILIKHLRSNLPSILQKLSFENKETNRSKYEWISAISEKVLSPIESSASIGPSITKEPNSTKDSNPIELTFLEIVSLGSYQHIVFTDSEEKLQIKLKAENINSDTFESELFFELRNGTNDVQFCETEYFGEDEYGPRVLIPFDSIKSFAKTNDGGDFAWLICLYNQIENDVNQIEDLDDLIRLMWQNLIKNKKKNTK
ncbi:hypothetical protein [Glaciecola sp. 1036]|uniref:hypothetical protein n=1 Tax=Alteromonadaceae TaxID=72275 RepID=UPI003D070371